MFTKVKVVPIKKQKKRRVNVKPSFEHKEARIRRKKMLKEKKKKDRVIKNGDIDIILDSISTSRSTAYVLLNWLKKHNKTISWNADRELLLYNQRIPGTDASELIASILRKKSSSEIPGYEMFMNTLVDLNIPKNLIINSNLRRRLEKN